MKFGSVCSGIEAASVAWHPLGWKAAWLSEIEPFPSAVLAHHYPDVPNLGDMTALPERILSGEVEAPDVFCGGTPCQAFSVAGLRNSLDDARGNLSLTFCEIANAIDTVRTTPAIIFWENVPGVLSTKDNAFGCFLGALAGEDEALVPSGGRWTNAGFIDGPQRAVAWRVLDAQYFGVAQRRKRVFVVASARADFDPASVLFEFDGLRRDTAPSREKGQAIAPCVTNGPPFSRTGNERVEAEAMVVQPYEVGNCLTARMHKGINSTLDEGQTPVISIHPHCIGRAPEAGPQGKEYLLDGSAYCMDSRGQPQAIAIQDVRPVEKAQNGKGWNDDGTAYTVDTHATQGVAQPMVLMDQGGSVMNVEHDIVGTLRRETHGHEPAVIQPPTMQVRRLTPVECERLQGFPDNYTNIPWRKKGESPDGPRYKVLGNSWAVPVVRWIGERIAKAA
jgi:DNA (cytosine-5)-methyltransferase 1